MINRFNIDISGLDYRELMPIEGKRRAIFAFCKRSFDIAMCVVLVPLLAIFAVALLIANPFMNRGPLIFTQQRMGRDCEPFTAIKFRSMVPASDETRSAEAPLEVDRITRLGNFIRKTRIDELPQVLNVLRGEMSLVGPRPDYYDHACHFLSEVPGYRERHSVRPGISGLAQTEVGYVEGSEATKAKVRADLYYIQNQGFRLEAWIVYRTFAVILGRHGS